MAKMLLRQLLILLAGLLLLALLLPAGGCAVRATLEKDGTKFTYQRTGFDLEMKGVDLEIPTEHGITKAHIGEYNSEFKGYEAIGKVADFGKAVLGKAVP